MLPRKLEFAGTGISLAKLMTVYLDGYNRFPAFICFFPVPNTYGPLPAQFRPEAEQKPGWGLGRNAWGERSHACSLLAKAAEGVSDAKGFEEKARQLNLGLEVYKAFKEQITGNHRPLQYNTEAANAIAKFISESVVANSKGTGRDLRSYFDAVPRQPVDTGDLYE